MPPGGQEIPKSFCRGHFLEPPSHAFFRKSRNNSKISTPLEEPPTFQLSTPDSKRRAIPACLA
jgi:hypothetical protein